jgi:SAM-dependent methyltransferase
MLDRARAATTDRAITYHRANLEELSLPAKAYDLAYSSLAFHYVEDAERLYRTIHDALVPGGRLVFSTEHPIFMASSRHDWMMKDDGSRTWPVDRYSVEGRRQSAHRRRLPHFRAGGIRPDRRAGGGQPRTGRRDRPADVPDGRGGTASGGHRS